MMTKFKNDFSQFVQVAYQLATEDLCGTLLTPAQFNNMSDIKNWLELPEQCNRRVTCGDAAEWWLRRRLGVMLQIKRASGQAKLRMEMREAQDDNSDDVEYPTDRNYLQR